MGYSTDNNKLAIISQYIPKGSLFHILHRPKSNIPLDPKRRLRMAQDLARGILYLHSRKPPIVHRDLKSPNLLVDRDFTVRVCDFGLSRVMGGSALSTKNTIGTYHWMAPEVLRGENRVTEKCDVFSVGVIICEPASLLVLSIFSNILPMLLKGRLQQTLNHGRRSGSQ